MAETSRSSGSNSVLVFFVLPLAVLLLGIWCSSGTLAPYAATLQGARVWEPCKYLLNIDHDHFFGTFLFLDGAGREHWEWSVVLRRLLYPVLAYPFMKQWGYEIGGFLTNLLLLAAAFTLTVRYLRKTYGERAGRISAWILATYPGIHYWAGLPYSYAIIIPAALISAICLDKLSRAENLKEVLWPSLIMGFAFTGYDLLPFFGPAACLVLLRRRTAIYIPVAILFLLLPSLGVVKLLAINFGVNFSNTNSSSYSNIVGAYLAPPPWNEWFDAAKNTPRIALHNFFFSNFLFIPVFFLLTVFLRLPRRNRESIPSLSRMEWSLLLSIGAVFLFNNLAPPYQGWQLRGYWVARIYQPLFVVFLWYLARSYAQAAFQVGLSQTLSILAGIVVMLNAAVVFGPVTKPILAEPLYYNFYQHSPPQSLSENLKKYGQRPLGFCSKAPVSSAQR